MSIDYLSIRDLRNISAMDVQPDSRLNIIHGANGSGKTSLLEAIYLLGRGKSFRSALSRSIIKRGSESLLVFGKLSDSEGQTHKLGIQIQSGGFKAKLDGQNLKKSSDLANYLPLLYVSPDADKLINSSPRQRRRFLDWGLFHVEPDFLNVWQRYNKIVTQRNAILKQGNFSQLPVWEKQWLQCAHALHIVRLTYVERLASIAEDILAELSGLKGVKFDYKPGWPKGEELEPSLLNCIESDKRVGYSHRGPHRADLEIRVEGRAAGSFLSGGQQKVVAVALMLAQTTLLNRHSTKQCVLLVDDIAAELDIEHRERFMKVLLASGSQLFVTATDPNVLPISGCNERRVFHVEHGTLLSN